MTKTTTPFRMHTVIAPTMFALAAAAVIMPAAAATDTGPTAKVSYSDLDLSRPAGVNALYGRIRMAAQTVCGPRNSRDMKMADQWSSCVDKAIARAVADAHEPALAELYAEKTGKSTPSLALLTNR